MKIQIENNKATAPCVLTKKAFSDAIADAGYFEVGNVQEEHGYRRDYPPCLWCAVKKIVLFDDPDSVSLVDAKVWRNNITGTAFMEQGPDAEKRARESASTHQRCNTCLELIEIRSFCWKCADDKERQNYYRKKLVPYSGQPCFIYDTWFFDECSLRDHLLEHDILPKDAMLEEGEPHDLPEIELDHWHDNLPEDYDESTLHSSIMGALDNLNNAIREHGKSVVYYPSGNRIELPDDFMAEAL